MTRMPFGLRSDNGPAFPQFPLDYNAFHIQRIRDVILGKETPCLGGYQKDTANRLRIICESFCEIHWDGKKETDWELFNFSKTYWSKNVKTLEEAALWAELAFQYLICNYAINVKEGMQQ